MRSSIRTLATTGILALGALFQGVSQTRAEPSLLGTGVSPGRDAVFFQETLPSSPAARLLNREKDVELSAASPRRSFGLTAERYFSHNPEGYLRTVLQRARRIHPEAAFTALEAQLNREDSILFGLYKDWAEIPPSFKREWTKQQVVFLRAVSDFLQTAHLSPAQLRENIMFLSHFNQMMSVSQAQAVHHKNGVGRDTPPAEVFYLPAVLLSGRHRGLLGAWRDLLAEGALTLDEAVLGSSPPHWLRRSFENAS